ncbi:MAG: thioredoxin [Bacteroidales bacterium]|jgi:thioredoxin|nr:thioredoxin [Bacteroidales bacterium]MDD2824839.1 thioredoxin [Bacteroidales bacterium]MDD3100127.1 thioredoxin [Bacteroidales bacterium]MDD3639266.1 thioredoxin [Bacteroidales bacterium]MDD3945091.1 thioredoxin [Bacteroidales bacterium]
MKTIVTLLALLPAVILFAGDKDASEKTKESKIKIMELTKEEFINRVYNYEANPNEWKYEGDKPCIVDFHATWCAPCKMLAPSLEEINQEYNGQIYIYKVDVDKSPELAAIFGVRSVPTLLWIPLEGKPSISQGALPKSQLESIVNKTLLNKE